MTNNNHQDPFLGILRQRRQLWDYLKFQLGYPLSNYDSWEDTQYNLFPVHNFIVGTAYDTLQPLRDRIHGNI